MYQFIDKLHTLYGLLQDERSKEIFQARFAFDMEGSLLNIERIVSLGPFKDQAPRWNTPLNDILKKLNRENKKIILYGTAMTGKFFADILQLEQIDFYGFCGQHSERFPDGLMGKPVISPDELVAHKDEYYILLTVNEEKSYTEISQFLLKSAYPEKNIFPNWINFQYIYDSFVQKFDEMQYFEFPELYRRGTAFVDGGCFDCETSRKFAEWCGGAYSSIIAFEPDPDNYAQCCKNVRDVPLPNFQLINAGLSSQEGTAVFNALNNSLGSYIISVRPDFDETKTNIAGNIISIRTAAIDDIVGDRTVGFIKLDIEGAELDALHGAKNTIARDKPLLAICVYHKHGDLFAIMDYLHQLLPEYRFLLRHYSTITAETILYASVDL